MGVVGKYNCRVWFYTQGHGDDGYGGEVQVLNYGYQEGSVYKVRGRLMVSESDRVATDMGMQQETKYNLEIRANNGWRPKKGMIVGVDDGYRVFSCVVMSIKNEDMKRKFWDLQILEME